MNLSVPQFMFTINLSNKFIKNQKLSPSPVWNEIKGFNKNIIKTNDSHINELLILIVSTQLDTTQQKKQIISPKNMCVQRIIPIEESISSFTIS